MDRETGYVGTLNRLFARIGVWSYDYRYLVVVIGLLAFIACIWLASLARVDMTFEAFFEEKDPTYSAYRQYRADFGSDEVSYILYEVPDSEHGPFDLAVMQKIAGLTAALEEEVPFLREVTSLANVEILLPVEDGLEVRQLVDDFPQSQEELLDLRGKILDKPVIVGGLLSRDAKYGAIILEMERSSVDPPEKLMLDPNGDPFDLENLYPQAPEAAIEKILSRPEYAGIRFYHAGDVPWNASYNRIMIPQTLNTMMLTYLVVGLLLYLFLRRALGVIGPFIVVTIAVAVSAAIIGMMGWSLDLMFPFVPNLLIAIGVADSVHIVSEFNAQLRATGDRREAVARTMGLVGTPCLLTSVTTAAGFLSMSFSHIKSMSHMAFYSAAGVMAAFLLSITLLMALLAMGKRYPATAATALPDPGMASRVGNRWVESLLAWISQVTIRYPVRIVAVSLLICMVAFPGVQKLRIDNDFITEWQEDEPIRVETHKVDQVMGGMSNVIYLFDTGKPDGIKDPAVLREIERVQMLAESHAPFVTKTYSIVDVVKDLNRTFHNNDPAYYRIPEDRELVAQLLLVYEMSGGEDIDQYVSGDFSRANLEIRCRMERVSHMEEMIAGIDAELAKSPLVHSEPGMTGIGALWVKFSTYTSESQIQGMVLAFVVIAIMMCLIFRSVTVGLLSMIPNIFPVFVTLGYMGWVGMDLDYTRLLIAPLALGIAVDDTIHLVARYHAEFRRLGNYAEALRVSIRGIGRALIATTVILVLGFLVNVFHDMVTQVVFGQLIAWTLFVALIADFFLMPAMILLLKPFGPEFDPGKNHEGERVANTGPL